MCKGEFNDELTNLAINAQKCLPLTDKRKEALTKLVIEVLHSGKLWKPNKEFNEHVYEDAVQELFLFVCQRIDNYNPERAPFIVWVNMLLFKRFTRVSRKEYVRKITSVCDFNISVDEIALPEEAPNLEEMIAEYISLDPLGIFRNEYIKNFPNANFQYIDRRRRAGDKWKTISADLGIENFSTVSNFYYRSFKKFTSIFRENVLH